MIANVIPETKIFSKEGFFSYQIPDDLSHKVNVGSIVTIPFGKRKIRGVVKEIYKKTNSRKKRKYQLRTISEVDENFIISKEFIEIADWISNYYLCSMGEAISIFMPPIIKKLKNFEYKEYTKNKKLNPLTTLQKEIFDRLKNKLLATRKKPTLIFGVTGSGKTEIYLHLAKETIRIGKSVILLVPEIILTPQNIQRFEEIFASNVVLMHSGLSASEKYRCYKSFYDGEKKIIVGPRSALLVPNNNIGLIIVDEEQEDSYKQEQNPRYDASQIAEKIAKKQNALLLLGSATPRIESYYKSKKGTYDLEILPGRFNTLTLPEAEIIDLKNEIKKENFSPISERLQELLYNVLKKKEQAILFLNRRGMATFVSCRDCGFVANCPHCDIPLIYHLEKNRDFLTCHHCQKEFPLPAKCPDCKSFRIKYFGSGVEKIEIELKRLLPKARIKKVDSKVLRNHTEYEKFYQNFRDHKFDFVVGTQILAKGFDIPDVSLVGIISADVGLHLPHFRALEKIFRLITQVSGRSGRRSKSGKTIIQTYWPNSAAIKYAAKHDFEGFYNEEIKKRLAKNYPPKNHLIRILNENKNKEMAFSEIKKLASEFEKNNIEFIGPGQCFFHKLNNKFRYQIIIKTEKLPNSKISNIYQIQQKFTWDVDPINLL